MKVFITGGGGFLGSYICSELFENDEVISFSRNTYPMLESMGIKQIQGDLAYYSDVENAMRGCVAVFHVAAKAGIWGEEKEYYETNVIGTQNIIKACQNLKVKYLIYTSSPSVIFQGKKIEGQSENDLNYPQEFLATYPKTKAMAEKMILAANSENLKTVALRPHLIWGPGDEHFLPRLKEKKKQNKLRLIGKGEALIDHVYVENASYAHVLALREMQKQNPKLCGKAYFITQNNPVSVLRFVNMLLNAMGEEEVKEFIPEKTAYFIASIMEKTYRLLKIKKEPALTRFMVEQLAKSHYFDGSAAKNDFGYEPIISTQIGLDRLKNFIKNKT